MNNENTYVIFFYKGIIQLQDVCHSYNHHSYFDDIAELSEER